MPTLNYNIRTQLQNVALRELSSYHAHSKPFLTKISALLFDNSVSNETCIEQFREYFITLVDFNFGRTIATIYSKKPFEVLAEKINNFTQAVLLAQTFFEEFSLDVSVLEKTVDTYKSSLEKSLKKYHLNDF